MKKTCLLIFAVFMLGTCFSQTNINKTIIGKWKGTDSKNHTGTIEFLDSIHIIITSPKGEIIKGTYLIDTTKKPAWIDIEQNSRHGQKLLPGFLKIVNANTLKLQLFFDGPRPKNPPAETSKDTQKFTRVRE